jgi:hypothetical protein
MSTPIGHTARYPHPLSVVHAAFTGEQYWKDRLEEVGGPGARLIGVTGTDPVQVQMVQAIAEADLPEAITKVRKGDLVIDRTETWGATVGGFLAVVEGAPVRISGTVALTPDGDGCLVRIDGQVEVDVPLFGRKIEAGIAERLTALFTVEESYTLAWLADDVPAWRELFHSED